MNNLYIFPWPAYMLPGDSPEVLKLLGDYLDNVDGDVLPYCPRQYLFAFKRAWEIVREKRTPETLAVLARPCGALDDLNLDYLDDLAGMPGLRRRDAETGRMAKV